MLRSIYQWLQARVFDVGREEEVTEGEKNWVTDIYGKKFGFGYLTKKKNYYLRRMATAFTEREQLILKGMYMALDDLQKRSKRTVEQLDAEAERKKRKQEWNDEKEFEHKTRI